MDDFETFLAKKKIDSTLFQQGDNALWLAWKKEFDQMSVNSFVARKLNHLNAVRRKYAMPFVEKPITKPS